VAIQYRPLIFNLDAYSSDTVLLDLKICMNDFVPSDLYPSILCILLYAGPSFSEYK
jgi:hypothetical protein